MSLLRFLRQLSYRQYLNAIAPPIVQNAPVLSNFNVDNTNLDRVNFDSSKIITASTITGFTISGKTISSITINTGQLTGHYFTLTSFDFWQQGRTIRYVGGSDIVDVDSKAVLSFTLQHIRNNISEPTFLRERYVTVAGAGTSDGSIGNEWTFAEALTGAIAGDLVHVQAGNYGGANYAITKSGTAANPIVFQGYKTNPNDITSNYYVYGTSTDSATEMPMFDHADRTTGVWITNDTGRQYWIFRNLQAKAYEYGMKVTSSANCLYERVNIFNGGDPVVQQFANFSIRGDNTTLKNCISVNHSFALFRMTDSYILVENCEAYCNETSGTDPISTDYYLTMRTANSVALNNKLHRDGDLQHLGHGFVLRYSGSTLPMKWNLIEGGWVKNIKQAIQLSNTTYNTDNVIRGIDVLKDYNVPNSINGGIVIYNDVVGSTFENIRLIDVDEGVEFLDNAGGHTFKNILFDNVSVVLDISQAITAVQNNRFIHNTFSSTTNLMNSSNDFDATNSFENSIFESISTINAGTGTFSATFTNSDFFNGFATPSGTGNISLDPNFVDLTNFVSQEVGLVVAPRITGVEYDYLGNERETTTTMGFVKGTTEFAAPDYYVALAGDNTDGLTQATAWNNLTTVSSQTFAAGDVIGFKGGDKFKGTLTLNSMNGASGNVIRFTSYGTGQAIITDSEDITGFTDEGGNIWSYAEAVDIGQVFKNGVALFNASTDRVNRFTITSNSSQTVFISNDLISYVPAIVGATVYLATRQYAYYPKQITAFNATIGEVTIDSAPAQTLSVGNDFYIVNAKDLLASQDDWSYDLSANKLYVYSITSPTGISIVKGSNTGISMDSSSYLTIDNLDINSFNIDGIYISKSSYITIDNCNFDYNYELGVNGLETAPLNNFITVSNSTISNINHRGITIYGTNSTVSGNTINNIALTNAVTWWGIWNPIGINLKFDNNTASNNTITNSGYNSMSFSGQNNIIEKNYIKDFSLNLVDGGGIYTFNGDGNFTGTGQTGTIVRKNIIIQTDGFVTQGGSIFCIYLDDYSHGITVENNTTIGSKRGLFLHNNRNITATGNNLYDADESGLSISEDKYDGAIDNSNVVTGNDIFIEHNNYYNAPLRITSNKGDNYNFFSSLDNNRYYSIGNFTAALVQTTLTNFINSSFPKEYELSQWKTLISMDTSSTMGADKWTSFETGTVLSTPIPLQDFAGGISGWSVAGGSIVDGGGFLRYTPSSTTSITFNNGLRFDVVTGDIVVVQFDYKTDVAHDARVAFTMTGAPNSSLGNKSFLATTTWRTFKQYYTSSFTGVDVRGDFYSNHATALLDIDNLIVTIVSSVSENLTVPLSHIAYNKETTQQNITLPSGTWQDFDGVNHTSTITLQPFTSEILIKQ